MSPLEPMKINSRIFTGGTWDAATLSATVGSPLKRYVNVELD